MRGKIHTAASVFAGLAIAPLAVGGVHFPIVLSLLVLFFVTFAWRIFSKQRPVRIPLAAIAAVAISAVCALQLVPLPPFLFEMLNPTLGPVAMEGAGLLGNPSPWLPISIDATQTADRGLRFLTLGVVCLLIANVNKRGSWDMLIRAIAVTAGLVFIIGLILMLTDTTSLIFYESPVGFRRPSTFVNTNHGASFFGFVLLVAAAWFDKQSKTAPDRRSTRQMTVAGALATGSALLVVVHDSVGVLLALAFAGWVYAISIPRWFRPSTFAVPLIVGLSVMFTWWLDVPKAIGWEQPFGDTTNRALVTHAGIDAARDHWIVGTGAGSMDRVMASVIDWTAIHAYTIPTLENEILEAFVAFGFLGGLIFTLALIAWIALSVRRAHASPKSKRARWHAALIAYLSALALFHFPFFTMGLSIPLLLAIQTTDTTRHRETSRKLFLLGIVGVLASVFVGSFFVTRFEPMDPDQYIDAATIAVNSGDNERAAELATFVSTLDGRPRIQHYAARAMAKSGRQKESAEFYKQLFRTSNVTIFRTRTMLLDIEKLSTRLEIAQLFNEAQFAFTLETILASEGPVRALDFAYLAIDHNIHKDAADTFVVETFIDLGQTDLALLWAESTNRSSDLAARIKLGSQEYDEAIALIRQNPAKAPFADILRHAIPLLERDAGDLVDAARDSYCASPLPQKRRLFCWSAEAAQVESTGDVLEADRMYDAITRRLGDPRPQAKFLVRHDQCKKVETMVIHEERPTFKSKLERILKTCGH